MIRCDGCGRHVRETEPSCPFCEGGRRSPTAHRAIQWMGGAATTMVLAACYGGSDLYKYDTGAYTPTGPVTGGTTTGTTTGGGTMTGVVTGTLSGTTSTGTTSGTNSCAPSGGSTLGFQIIWTDDGLVPTDTDSDFIADYGCGDSVQVCIDDPMMGTTWSFGMAETSSMYGWTGEDCLYGYAGYSFCHPVVGTEQVIDEVTSCQVGDVVAGQTTLLDAAKDPFLTYYFSDGTDCFVFGDDPTYYDALGCSVL